MQACQPHPQGAAAAEVLATGPQSSTRFLSPAAMTLFSFAGAMLIAASSSRGDAALSSLSGCRCI